MGSEERNNLSTSFKLALAALFAALVFVVTSLPPISIPATTGYFNLGETIIYTAALVAGPLAGGIAGGVGASLADLYLGYAVFAPGTFVIKGVEGVLVAFLNQKLQSKISNMTLRAAVSVVIGGLEMVTGYFLYEQLVLGTAAILEVPFNLVQMTVGLMVAIPVMHAVLRVFPQLKS